MAKKRKDIQVIQVEPLVRDEEKGKPLCFGQREVYCKPEICGQEWFDKCSKGGLK